MGVGERRVFHEKERKVNSILFYTLRSHSTHLPKDHRVCESHDPGVTVFAAVRHKVVWSEGSFDLKNRLILRLIGDSVRRYAKGMSKMSALSHTIHSPIPLLLFFFLFLPFLFSFLYFPEARPCDL